MTGSILGTPFNPAELWSQTGKLMTLNYCFFVCILVFFLSFFLPPASLPDISNYPESTTANSDVISESMVETNDPIPGNEKAGSGTAPETDEKLCLRMKLVSPETEASEESLHFSLESKFYF